MAEFGEMAKGKVLTILDRAIKSYTAASGLSALALVSGEELMPIFRRRSETGINTLVSSMGLDASHLDALKKRAADVSLASAQNAVAAACLVFSHSLADVAIGELCMIAADFDRAYWVRRIENRTLTVRQIVKKDVNDLLRSEIQRKILAMGLPERMKHLRQHAGLHCEVHYPGFTYSQDRLDELDMIRHRLVHGIARLSVESSGSRVTHSTTPSCV
jgi:hypothetical protein